MNVLRHEHLVILKTFSYIKAERCVRRDCMDYIATGTSCTSEGDAPGKDQHESCTVLLARWAWTLLMFST
jgi:hypothetical protein